MVGDLDEAGMVAMLVRQMVEHVSVSFVVARHAGDFADVEAQRHDAACAPGRHRRVPAPARRHSASTGTPPRRRRAPTGASSTNTTADGEAVATALGRRASHSAGSRADHGAPPVANGVASAGVTGASSGALWKSVRQRLSARQPTAYARPRAASAAAAAAKAGASAAGEPSIAGVPAGVLGDAGPNGGDPAPGEGQFSRCSGDAAVAGDEALARMAQRRVAQLSALRYESIREEKRERIERSRAAALAHAGAPGLAVGGVVQAQFIFTGEQLAAMMKLERARVASLPSAATTPPACAAPSPRGAGGVGAALDAGGGPVPALARRA
ncbi:hypothetical protein KFE25_000356 [Diacronema lutheri]|uniref:Uncharacterized protein n=1 Tax=Diacronema lutheri TaxID=2081491 RepID=A0A8J5XSD9_DIALT|nr:hypothetical protein KFE25_000356 [Diacronema lutheri]